MWRSDEASTATSCSRAGSAPELHDYRTPQFSARVEAGQRRDLAYELVFKQGYNKKQDNVTLKRAS